LYIKGDGEEFNLEMRRKHALDYLARLYVRCFDIPKIAVTGSNGKGSTCELIRYILAQKLNVNRNKISPGESFFGFFDLTEKTQVAISEAAVGSGVHGQAFNGFVLNQADFIVFTNIDYVHSLKTIDDPLEEKYAVKTKLLDYLSPTGIIYIDGNNEYYRRIKPKPAQNLKTYGLTSDMDFYADNITYNSDWTTSFDLCTGAERINIRLPLPGKHLVLNACAAAAVAYDFGFSLEEIKSGLEMSRIQDRRSQIFANGLSVTLIDDCYNASPESMKAAVDMLTSYHKDRRKVIFFGGMAELGKLEVKLHEEIARYIDKFEDIDVVVFSGVFAEKMAAQIKTDKTVLTFKDSEEVLTELEDIVQEDDVLLVKGSRGVTMDVVSEKIKQIFRAKDDLKDLRAGCAAIFDLDADKYIFRKNILKRYAPASNTKIVTALLALENANLDDEVIISEEVPARWKLTAGEKFKFMDCLKGMLIASDNALADALADALAVHVAGSVAEFVKMMNEFVNKIGMKHTGFVDAWGGSRKNFTCVADMIKLCKVAFKNKIFMSIVGMEEYKFSSTIKEYTFKTTNKTITKSSQLYNESALGGKTGTLRYPNSAKTLMFYEYVLVNFYRHNEHTYITVQGDLHYQLPFNCAGLYDGALIRFEDANRMQQYICSTIPAVESATEIETPAEPEIKRNPANEVAEKTLIKPVVEKKILPEEPFFNFNNNKFIGTLA